MNRRSRASGSSALAHNQIRQPRRRPRNQRAFSRCRGRIFRFFDFSREGLNRFKSEFTPERVTERLSNAEFRYYVAQHNGVLAGVCALRAPAHLYNLFTRTEFHRQGVARALWQHLHAELVAAGVHEVTVNASTYALGAYERLGFVRSGTTQELGGVIFTPMTCCI